MTVRDISRITGMSSAAVYKKIKAHGMTMNTLKDKETGRFTPEAEKQLKVLFNIADDVGDQVEKVDNQVDNQAEKVDNQVVNQLSTEVEKLKAQVAALEAQVETITGERDYLRAALERSQQTIGLMTMKLPTPPPSLPAATDQEGHEVKHWWQRITRRAKS